MKKFIKKIYFNRDAEDNLDIMEHAESNDWDNHRGLVYIGYEVGMEIEVREDLKHKVLKINNIDVSDKEIYI